MVVSDERHSWHLAIDDDPALLRIYGDWLMDQGDPIGHIIAEMDNVVPYQYKHKHPYQNLAEWFDRRYNSLSALILNTGEPVEKTAVLCDHTREQLLNEMIENYAGPLANFPVTLDLRHRWELTNRRRPSVPGMGHFMFKCLVWPFAITRHLNGPHLHVVIQKRASAVRELRKAAWITSGKDIKLPKTEFFGYDEDGFTSLLIPLLGFNPGEKVPPIRLSIDGIGPLLPKRVYKFNAELFGISPQVPISLDTRKGYQAIEISGLNIPKIESQDNSVYESLMTSRVSSRYVRE